jgi:hypothetical protein
VEGLKRQLKESNSLLEQMKEQAARKQARA